MKTFIVITLFAASFVLGCGKPETVSTDTAVTDTVAPEDAVTEGGEKGATDTGEKESPTAETEPSESGN